MRANSLVAQFAGNKDKSGRLEVDSTLHIVGSPNCFAAGDVAYALTDGEHYSLMSCQHAMPQGRVAGHNAIAELFQQPLVEYQQSEYSTCLDLGSWGALYAKGWDRKIKTQGAEAKKTKMHINHERIYPSIDGGLDQLLSRAEPVFKPVPSL